MSSINYSNLKIRKAVLADLDKNMRIISLCTKHMISKKFFSGMKIIPQKIFLKKILIMVI